MRKIFRSDQVTRRDFVGGSLSALGIASVFPASGRTQAFTSAGPQSLTVGEIIDTILKNIPVDPLRETVDTLKAGTPDMVCTGIVSTMFATVEVIRKTILLKSNFIIAHEPTFYNHLDETGWLEGDKVYEFKKNLLNQNNIAVWRFHDYIHRHQPDGVRMGVLTKLGWESYYDANSPRIVTLPATPLKYLISHVKNKLGISKVRYIGDQSQLCRRIALMPGASGGRSHIQLIQEERPDVLICGEVAEWETSEYIRDTRSMGTPRSLIVLGHAQSEEPGMDWVVPWLQPKVPGIKVTHIASDNPFSFS